MITPQIRSTIQTLKAQGHSLRHISQLLKLSRNTVRRCLAEEHEPVGEAPVVAPGVLLNLKSALTRANGNAVRAQELLAAEYELEVPYSTLTRWARESGLREPPGAAANTTSRPAARCSMTLRHTASPLIA
jgi:transposase